MPQRKEANLGDYLVSRRHRLDAVALGFGGGRRRTPGLRREEVAQRAGISATWYTWLEQGRGGRPSAEVLNRIAKALLLTEGEREHVFWIALGRPPEIRYRAPQAVAPRIQRVLDAVSVPALVRTATWDVVAWNRPAQDLWIDFSSIPPRERNVLRMMFLDPRLRAAQFDWENVARFVVSAFRTEATRAGAVNDIAPIVEELSTLSTEFADMWEAEEGPLPHRDDRTKRLRHPELGSITLEYSVFAVDGRPDLQLVVMNPVPAPASKGSRKPKRRNARRAT